MLRVALVPSHPFHTSLGTDFRMRHQILPMAELNVEIHYVSPFSVSSLPENGNVYVHRLDGRAVLNDGLYKFTRTIFNSSRLAPAALFSPNLLVLAARSYARQLAPVISEINPDVVLAIHQVAAAACGNIKKSLRCPLVADIHSVWAEELVASRILVRNSSAFDQVRQFESYLLKSTDIAIVVSDELKTYLNTKLSMPRERIEVVGPCMDPKFDDAKRVERPRRLVFSGMANWRERFDLILGSMRHVLQSFPDAELYATRKGDQLDSMRRIATELGVSPRYFYFSDSQSFYRFLRGCHIGLISSQNDIARRLAYPAKIWDYMAVGLPIVANDVGAWSRFIRESGAGILTDSTPEAFADGVTEIMNDPNLAYEMGQNGLSYLRTTMKANLTVRQFIDTLTRAAHSSSRPR